MDRGRESRGGFRKGPSRGQSSHRGRSEGIQGGFRNSSSEGQRSQRGKLEGTRGGFRGQHPRSHSQSGARGGRGAHVNAAGDQEKSNKRHIGYQKLVSWADETDPDHLVVLMVSETDALIDLLKQMEIKSDWYNLLFKACRLILSVNHQRQALKKVLTVFVDSHFFGHNLYNFVEKKRIGRWHDAKAFYEEVLLIFKEIMKLLPQCVSKCQMPLTLLRDMVQSTKEVCQGEDLLRTISELQDEVKKVQLKNIGEPKFRKKVLRYNDSDIPPEDFRELSVVPQAYDLNMGTEPFVRAILSKGSYRDNAHYLDILFRLMREDFIQPLREGINEFKMKGCRKDYRSSDIRLYFDVRIIGMTTVNGINHVLEFDMKSLKSVNWEHSKRFLTGSLLCLSKDNFETLYFATAAFRNPKDLKDGIITVEFKSELADIFCTSSSEIFVMAETTAYFEVYCPVLEGLKEIDSSFSHQKYFIYCQETLKPPEYLLGGVVRQFDLASLTKTGQQTLVPVLNTMSWPQVDKMNLNESQREAVQLALTKELAIIQGPPGTGKTYVGLKVMKVLLENLGKMAGNNENQNDPILVVCFTNHALDQFLEGVLEFCPKGIVRVGGRSSSELLENMNLKNLKKNQQLAFSVKKALWGARDEIKHISNKIKNMKSKLDSLYFLVQTEQFLEQFMLPNHYSSLQAQFYDGFSKGKGFSTIKNWLNAPTSLSKDTLSLLIKKHMTELVLKMQNVVFINDMLKQNKLKESIMKMPVIERACVYQGWLNVFLSSLKHGTFNYFRFIEASKTKILTDSEISSVIPSQIFNMINSLSHETSSYSIENWIIGSDKNLSHQLDDIESLTQFYSHNGQNDDEVTDDVDEVVRSQNDRLIDSDFKIEEEIAAATKEIKEGDFCLQIKAEKLGIKDDSYEEKDEYGWQTVTHRKPLSFSMFKTYVTETEPMTEEEEKRVEDLWTLEIKKRFALYNLWIQRYRSEIAKDMECLVQEYEEAMKGKRELSMTSDIDILKNAKVIGMTTTGAAKNRKILQAVGCRIIVVEEAAEVLEAHIITALNKNCKHLILIGDHQQLKPNPTVYTLAKDYHLDLSLFERLINNGIRHVTLKAQHRMRQSISKIMRHIYPDLQDHISVTKFDNVRGMQKNIFFINHRKLESDVSDSKSKSNAHEASYLVALLSYILLQGYKPKQITILATYVGQILLLKNQLKAKSIGMGVRVTTVDNFQGEENDIILLSLVRSNAHSNVGFLKVDNRVCVALSRAKKGLFAIGNFEQLSSQSELWRKIVETAEDDCIYGDGLPLTCPNHANFKVEISSPEDFQKKCPEGGCGLPCEFRLQCGHACPLKCHGYDSKHEEVNCVKKCAKSCSQGHPCKKKCIQKCGNCIEMVDKIIPRCGHTDKVPCYMPVQNAVCSQPCSVPLDCQHQCTGRCGECDKNKKHRKCEIQVEYFWPCYHICKVPCYMKPTEYPCPQKCQAILECGHKCEGSCFECVNGTFHAACKKQCTKFLPCGHQCLSLCGIPCPPCPKECTFSCRHSKCKSGQCGDECIPCQEPCGNRCKHAQCTKKCFEECDIEPCKKRCHNKLRKCQHPCSGLCGEMCICALCHFVSVLPQSNQRSAESKKDVAMSQNNELYAKQSEDIAGNSEINETTLPCAVSGLPQNIVEGNMDGQNEAMPQNEFDKPEKREDVAGNSKISNTSLLIKIPSCGHIFYVNELDKYVNSLLIDNNLCYLPCPICKTDIQNCFRYNKMTKMRNCQKEKEKGKIRQINEITPEQRVGTSESQNMLNKIDLDGTWQGLIKVNVFDLHTSQEVISLNCKCKYAHVLGDLQLLDNQSKFKTKLISSSKAVLRLGKSLTQQQKSDFRIGLKYLLLNIYIIKFEETSRGSSLAENLIKQAKKVLKEKNLSQEVVNMFFSIVEALESKLKAVSLTVAKKTVARDLKILDSEDDQMLSDILRS